MLQPPRHVLTTPRPEDLLRELRELEWEIEELSAALARLADDGCPHNGEVAT